MKIYIFGNGNISFEDFRKYYELPVCHLLEKEREAVFLVCDFKGTDTLAMELLKSKTSNVKVFHVGEKPRYFPDKFKTNAASWEINGGFKSDEERDEAVSALCTHFLAVDFNSDDQRKSGTLRSIERCIATGKIRIGE